ncbi:efflux RND transporter permease subunit [Crateriforma spongiae]|uniref:efflux RND transporter permease subunit n=1 Tax=Crateriforma spongiae TaxID=2724528 RepID=UPI0014479808|nr:efflux RND transporter permease subunit [Crateriforma spongiae]
MNLSALSVKYRPIVFSLIILMMVWGTITFFTMPRREDPEFTIRVCVVTTSWAGAPAEKVEELVTDKLEEKIVSLEEVETLRSTSKTGQSIIFVELNDDIHPSDIQNVWDKVRARVEQAEMPEDSVEPVVNDEFGDTAVLLLAIHQKPLDGDADILPENRYTPRQLEQFAELIEDELRLLPGVAKVDKFGIQKEAVYIQTDLGNWAQQSLTTSRLKRLASERNIIKPGGQLSTDDGFFTVKPGGEFDAIDEIRQIGSVVRSDKDGDEANSVTLSNLGLTVQRSYEDPPAYLCRFGNRDYATTAVTVAVTMQSGSNIIDICQRSLQRVDELTEIEQRLPPDVMATAISNQAINVESKISDVIVNVIEAILIVVLVVYLVVGARTSLVMAANIPVVVITSVAMISMMYVQLEQISLAAIIISLGLLVDNAVQVCDQARSNQIAGLPPFRAAVEGANTLAIPMLVGTLTTMAAFIPMLYALKGGAREYVYSLPVTVATTLGISWLMAMTFCVVLAGLFIRAPKNHAPASPPIRWYMLLRNRLPETLRRLFPQPSTAGESTIQRLYGRSLKFALRYKWSTLIFTLMASMTVFMLPVSSEFFPEAARDQFAVEIELPETATIWQTDAITREVEDVIRRLSPASPDQQIGEQRERLSVMRTLVGGGGSRWNLTWEPEPQNRSYAEILVQTTNWQYTADFVEEVRIACHQGRPDLGIEPIVGARVVPRKLALGPPADPLTFRIIGNGFADPAMLRNISNRVKAMVRQQPETWNVHDSWGTNGYQIQVDVDRDRATLAGVTNAQIAETLNSYYSGLKLTTFREGDHQVPIYFRLRPEGRQSVRGLQESFVEGDAGKVPLESLADFRFSWQPERIERRNMNRTIEVSSRVLPGVPGNDIVLRVWHSDAMKTLMNELPAGYRIEPGGAYEESIESGGQMIQSFGWSFVLIVFCLVFQYNGWAKPSMVLCTLPMALVGAYLGLALTNNTLGFMPQLGILALCGIVLNTAIIYIEFADILIREHFASSSKPDAEQKIDHDVFHQCLIDAGKQRMLPIFLTTATTVGGLLPLAISGGPLWVGLAWCMISGLILTTFLTLYVLPALYAVLVETFGIRPVPVESTELDTVATSALPQPS